MRFKFTFGFGGKRTVKCSCGATRYYGEPCDYCDVPDTYVPRSGEIFRSPNTLPSNHLISESEVRRARKFK